jgi:glucosamine-6-phosphate deaminase
MPQYEIAVRTINDERLSLAQVHTFNMDEYANEDGITAPSTWRGSFQRAMWERFFGLIDAELRPPEEQIHFPTTEALPDYSARIEDLGGADVCYGGIGWCTLPSGSPTSARSSMVTSRPTSRRGRGLSSCTR